MRIVRFIDSYLFLFQCLSDFYIPSQLWEVYKLTCLRQRQHSRRPRWWSSRGEYAAPQVLPLLLPSLQGLVAAWFSVQPRALPQRKSRGSNSLIVFAEVQWRRRQCSSDSSYTAKRKLQRQGRNKCKNKNHRVVFSKLLRGQQVTYMIAAQLASASDDAQRDSTTQRPND